MEKISGLLKRFDLRFDDEDMEKIYVSQLERALYLPVTLIAIGMFFYSIARVLTWPSALDSDDYRRTKMVCLSRSMIFDAALSI